MVFIDFDKIRNVGQHHLLQYDVSYIFFIYLVLRDWSIRISNLGIGKNGHSRITCLFLWFECQKIFWQKNLWPKVALAGKTYSFQFRSLVKTFFERYDELGKSNFFTMNIFLLLSTNHDDV